MIATLPPPSALLGLSASDAAAFPSWYPNQDRIMRELIDWITNPNSPKFLCATLPTGSGKSLQAAITAQLSGTRAVVLTSTKGLQDQFLADFHKVGFRDIRGQNSYPCILLPEAKMTVDEGPCHAGAECPHLNRDCIYYSELDRARDSRFVVTNYAFWLAQANMRPGTGVGRMPLLIMDEADDAFKAIESHLSANITREECRAANFTLPERNDSPRNGCSGRNGRISTTHGRRESSETSGRKFRANAPRKYRERNCDRCSAYAHSSGSWLSFSPPSVSGCGRIPVVAWYSPRCGRVSTPTSFSATLTVCW